MKGRLKFRCFAHSWVSDWNHGNAHFLRGLMCSLVAMGHDVHCYEQLGSWSLTNLVQQEGTRAIESIDSFRKNYPDLNVRFYNDDSALESYLRGELHGADVVIIHEWNDPGVVNTILGLRDELKFRALFHDTHHRAYTRPGEILRVQLGRFDGVLAFGEAIRKIYADGFGVPRVWTFHEAADVNTFKPLIEPKTIDVVWIGNWGDGERTKALEEFLIRPAEEWPKRRVVVHGVRYPHEALQLLSSAGIEFRGYLPNLNTPKTYAQSCLALHVPRQQYSNGLSGIPTIRVFEALACGIPLICSPWMDVEGLFRPGKDYVVVPDGEAMKAEIERLLRDGRARRQIAASGLETIRERHTCRHRAEELLEICEELDR
jgi:spore maturation protein CgeB